MYENVDLLPTHSEARHVDSESQAEMRESRDKVLTPCPVRTNTFRSIPLESETRNRRSAKTASFQFAENCKNSATKNGGGKEGRHFSSRPGRSRVAGPLRRSSKSSDGEESDLVVQRHFPVHLSDPKCQPENLTLGDANRPVSKSCQDYVKSGIFVLYL